MNAGTWLGDWVVLPVPFVEVSWAVRARNSPAVTKSDARLMLRPWHCTQVSPWQFARRYLSHSGSKQVVVVVVWPQPNVVDLDEQIEYERIDGSMSDGFSRIQRSSLQVMEDSCSWVRRGLW